MVGAGDKAFVSGADISQFEKTRHNAASLGRIFETERARSARYWPTIRSRPSPASAASVSVAACRSRCWPTSVSPPPTANSGIPAAKLGIAYGYDGLKHLVSLVGPSWARLMMYTGMRIDAAEALRIGLVHRVL